ncbi:alpha/beta hydrolase [Shewanella sp. Scap07]|uniref:alpha/beta fold hydrolase n=1 Tax=Shewanella sp. Scap07 TaxID=2589987 RepID=UPI0015BD13B3|nr:alpha/beta hydrolase [Shewanella sp. Scap07]QLE83979.1 alpha/beta hydrolase [Shewanella sp. Scap07]
MMSRGLHYFVVLLGCLLLSACSAVSYQQQREVNQLVDAGYSQTRITLEDGGTLSYWQVGQGEAKPTLLLVHGFGGDAQSSWQQVMLNLAHDYHIIAPDLAWFGQSYSHGEANLATQTQLMQELLDHLALTSVNLVGISYGGFVSFDLMVKDARVEKAVILASPAYLFSDAELAKLSQRFAVESPEAIFVPQNKAEMRHLLAGTFDNFPWYPGFIDEQIYQRYFAQWQPQKRSLIQTLPQHRDQIANDVELSQLPETLLIWGENDKVFPLSAGLALADTIKAPIVVIPDAPHGISNEYPEIVTRAIKEFIQ